MSISCMQTFFCRYTVICTELGLPNAFVLTRIGKLFTTKQTSIAHVNFAAKDQDESHNNVC